MAEDLVSILVHDHREVEQMFGRIEPMLSSSSGTQELRDLVDQAIIELVRHSVAEEQYLYPTVRQALPDGDQLADRELTEHAQAEETMKRLDTISTDNIEYPSLVRQLMQEIRQHVAEEEGELFPRMQQAMSATELEELGGKVQQAKKLAPTRPHPSAPDTPPANKLLGPGTGLIDRVRDTLTGRGRR